MGKKEIKKSVQREIEHRNFLNQNNGTDKFTTPMSEAFRMATERMLKNG